LFPKAWWMRSVTPPHLRHEHSREDEPASQQLSQPQHPADQQEAEPRGEDRLGGGAQ